MLFQNSLDFRLVSLFGLESWLKLAYVFLEFMVVVICCDKKVDFLEPAAFPSVILDAPRCQTLVRAPVAGRSITLLLELLPAVNQSQAGGGTHCPPIR